MRRFSGSDQALKLLEDSRAYIGRMPNRYECPLVIPWSGPPGGMSSARLAEYARTVIPQRLIQFTVFSWAKTHHFIDGYLAGMKTGNPFALFGMKRVEIPLRPE